MDLLRVGELRRRHMAVIARQDRLRDVQNPLEVYTNEDFRERYRFSKETVLYMVQTFADGLERADNKGEPLPPLIDVCTALRFFATNSFYHVIGDICTVSRGAAFRATNRVVSAVVNSADQFINYLEEDLNVLKEGFYNIARLPQVIGAVDCTHIVISKPSVEDYWIYRNRKNQYSINVQVVSGPDFKILDIIARWPGGTHDLRIFRNSQVAELLEEGALDGILLGDSGYVCRHFCLTPYMEPQEPHEIRYSRAQKRTRVVVEQTFGVFKRRFPCLGTKLRVRSPTKACRITIACAVLHNIGLLRGDVLSYEPQAQGGMEEEINEVLYDNDDDIAFRDYYARRYPS